MKGRIQMVSNQIIQKSMTELKSITGVDFCVLDVNGQYLFGEPERYSVEMDVIREFVNSEADSQAIGTVRFLKTGNEEEGLYIVLTEDNDNATQVICLWHGRCCTVGKQTQIVIF